MTEPPGALQVPHLADTSAWSKARNHSGLAAWFDEQLHGERIVTCDLVILELLRSARSHAAFFGQQQALALLSTVESGSAVWGRAHTVQALIAASGQQRGVPPADLLIAAAAELGGVPLLHYDHDYDLIAGVTGQPVRWLAPVGSLP